MSGMIESVTLILEVSIILLVLSNLFDKHLKMDIYTVSVIMAYLFIFEAINREKAFNCRKS